MSFDRRPDLPHGGLPAAPIEEVTARHPYPLLFMSVSGAHLYGFPSPDSDADLRGVHLLPADEVVGLGTPRETIQHTEVRDGLEVDLVTHDLAKFLRLLLKPNGYVLEQLMSPLRVEATPVHDISRVKPLLYTYRALLTGLHMLRDREVEADLRRLNASAALPGVDDLIAAKRAGAEKMTLDPRELAGHETAVLRLRDELEAEGERSPLPDEPLPATRSSLEQLLIDLRLGRRALDDGGACGGRA
jgi:predicted nucleotidyltransferase